MFAMAILTASVLAASDAPLRDPRAVAALGEMQRFVRSQPAMSVEIVSATDPVDVGGYDVQLGSRAQVQLRHAVVISAREQTGFITDGKIFAFSGPPPDASRGFVPPAPAPGMLAWVATLLATQAAAAAPVAELLGWGRQPDVAQLTTAIVAGAETLRGVGCQQYLFRQADLEWMVWIQQGDQPLPLKLVITHLGEAAMPRQIVQLEWSFGFVNAP